MRLIAYHSDTDIVLGIKSDAGVIPTGVKAADFYRSGLEGYQVLKDRDFSDVNALDEASLNLAPIVPYPGKIICVGLNYRAHAEETGGDAPDYPILFSKFNNALASHEEPIPLEADWAQVDYEAEMLAVIGKQVKHVSVEDALDCVLGYSVANDISERSLQFRSGQWLLGKTPDKFLPIGPELVTSDAVPDPQNLAIRGLLNGEVRQESNTSYMIFSVAEIIAYASKFMTLEAGDIISTGTPDGVILGYPKEERVWLKAGDTFTVEIEGIGVLSNTFVGAE